MFKHLHIVACSPRSGTTLLHEAMVTCLKVDKHYDHEMRFHKAWADDGQILLTKRPKDTMYMPAVLDNDPDFYVIYVLRDPRDVIVSRHGKEKDRYYSNVRLWRELHDAAKTLYGNERFLEVKYEDFVSRPDDVQKTIVERFPWLEVTHPFSEYHHYAKVSEKSKRAMHSVRPIAPSSVGLWKENLPRIKGQQELHGSLTPILIECGYETSDDWEKALATVDADRARSVYPERVHIFRRVARYLDAIRKVSGYRRRRDRARQAS